MSEDFVAIPLHFAPPPRDLATPWADFVTTLAEDGPMPAGFVMIPLHFAPASRDIVAEPKEIVTISVDIVTKSAEYGLMSMHFVTMSLHFASPHREIVTPSAEFVTPSAEDVPRPADFVTMCLHFVPPSPDIVSPSRDIATPPADFVTPSAGFAPLECGRLRRSPPARGTFPGGSGRWLAERESLLRVLPLDQASVEARPPREAFPAKRIVGWEFLDDLPGWEELQNFGFADGDAEEVMNAGYPRERDKLSGWPAWVQGAEYPQCPDCGSDMKMLFQIDSNNNLPYMFGDAGCGHITYCEKHPRVLAFGWACG